ncbi:GntR family transcriptional regulator [Candidatus Formimonas warabiya]|uniref:GntR family transcriptional regulator n=1 Tax=Formimonas warabiya TaxID=1761012 RepID=A0A3G1KY21_FORW1|nr:GntR family transcriptional regulator [Candidatus Formimonas warabiya]ATW27310.1 GntR family transcriptional regulator [Candidatus Formimonas warabiya]
MFQLDIGDRRPLYEQIKEKMKILIINGVMKANEQIPSVRELAQSLTINPNTIQKAYKDLEVEGFIYSVRAKGSFVTPLQQVNNQVRRDELFKDFDRVTAELRYINTPKEELISHIQRIYEEREAREYD